MSENLNALRKRKSDVQQRRKAALKSDDPNVGEILEKTQNETTEIDSLITNALREQIDFDGIPDELKKLNQWVLWTTENRKGKATKIPKSAAGSNAATDDPETWSAYDDVVKKLDGRKHDGIGFVFSATDSLCGVDFDGCRDPETGVIADWALIEVERLNSYTEVSPSQTGLKTFITADLKLAKGRKIELSHAPTVCNKNPAIEVYTSLRYFAVTGQVFKSYATIKHRESEFQELLKTHWPNTPIDDVQSDDWRSDDAVVERARKYVSRIPGAVSGSGGHNSTFLVACRLVKGFVLTADQAFAVISEWNTTCKPPWSDNELHHKLESASKASGETGYLRNSKAERWEKIKMPSHRKCDDTNVDLRNFATKGEDDTPLNMADIVAQVRRITDDWPRVCDGRLFVPDESGVRWIERSSQLTAYLSDGLSDPPKFKRSVGFISEVVLFEHLHVCQKRYEAIEFAPHEPAFQNRYYACDDIKPGDGRCLQWVLDRFEPSTVLDGDLVKSLLASSIWGGDGGSRPCFVVTAPDRGAGKTTLVEICGELTGGIIDIGMSDDPDKLKARLLSGEGRRRRIVLIDNAKSRKLSSAELEGLITCSTISGRANYVGESSRPNSLLWCVTMNGVSLSRDMAQRSVIIKLALPRYSGTWKEDTLNYVRSHRVEIIGDLIAFLRGPKKELRKYSRWGSWERHVLSLLPEPSEAQAVIAERQDESDIDDEETGLIAEHFEERLNRLGYATDKQAILIPSRVAATWYAESIGSKDSSQTKSSRDLNQKIEAGMLKCLHPMRRKDLGRGWVWWEKPALPPAESWRRDVEEKIEQREILDRQEKRWP